MQEIERVHADQLLGVVADAACRFRADVGDRPAPSVTTTSSEELCDDRAEARPRSQRVADIASTRSVMVLHDRRSRHDRRRAPCGTRRCARAVDLVLVFVAGSGAGREARHRSARIAVSAWSGAQRVADAAIREPRAVTPCQPRKRPSASSRKTIPLVPRTRARTSGSGCRPRSVTSHVSVGSGTR